MGLLNTLLLLPLNVGQDVQRPSEGLGPDLIRHLGLCVGRVGRELGNVPHGDGGVPVLDEGVCTVIAQRWALGCLNSPRSQDAVSRSLGSVFFTIPVLFLTSSSV